MAASRSLFFTKWLDRRGGREEPSRPGGIYVVHAPGSETAGEVVAVSPGRISVRLPIRLANGLSVEIRVRDCHSQAHVLYSRPEQNRFFITLALGEDRRMEPRFTANQRVELSVIASDNPMKFQGRMVDVSQSGVGLILKSRLKPGMLVEIRARGVVAFGKVQHCSSEGKTGTYRIGVAVEESLLGSLAEGHLFSGSQLIRRGLNAIVARLRRMQRGRVQWVAIPVALPLTISVVGGGPPWGESISCPCMEPLKGTWLSATAETLRVAVNNIAAKGR